MDSEIRDAEAFAYPELDYSEPPAGSDRRSFMMRSAMAAAIVAVGGQLNPLFAQTPAGAPPGSQPVDPNLEVVKKSKGPVMTLLDEFYKVGPGPSSSHTAGACRLGQMARAIAGGTPERAYIRLHGSFAATGEGHGTHRALVGGLIGLSPDDLRLREAYDEATAQGIVRAPASQRGQLEEGRIGVEQQLDPLPREELAAVVVPLDVALTAALQRLRLRSGDDVPQRCHPLGVGPELLGARVEGRPEDCHRPSS
jgi:hypothetical protein